MNKLTFPSYRQKRKKTDIVTETKENDTVVYREIYTYDFMPDMSNGDETDMVTILNIPYVVSQSILLKIYEYITTEKLPFIY